MATVNYSWNLPTVGGSEDTWGTSLNANWTDLDTLLGGVSQTEFAILDGATVSTAELNLLDGVTWTLADYNTLTATATELNLLDGITALSGSDTEIVTGTAGTDGQIGKWNADGDLIGVGTNTANGDVVVLEDVSGSPGLPAVDGSQLTGIAAGAPAWANYDQTTPAITASENVSSITDVGSGAYTVNLTNNMADANYAISFDAEALAATDWPLPILNILGTLTIVNPTTSAYSASTKGISIGFTDWPRSYSVLEGALA